MLVISRKTEESITIGLADGLDPSMTLREVFGRGPIEIRLIGIRRSRARLAIAAPLELRVWRGQLPDLNPSIEEATSA